MITEKKPRAIVARENYQGVTGNLLLVKRLQNLPHRPIDFCHYIPVQTSLAFPSEFFRSCNRHVRHWMGYIKKKRIVFVLFNKLHSPFGIQGCQFSLIIQVLNFTNGLVPLDQRQCWKPVFNAVCIGSNGVAIKIHRPHIVWIWKS